MSDPSLVPYTQISESAWTHLARAAAEPEDPMRLVTLATVGVDRRPSARLMVLRGADRQGGLLWFHTDLRSTKVADLRANPFAVAVAYDPRNGVQLRASGTVVLRTSGPIADRHWEQTEVAVRYLYATHEDPGPDPRLERMVQAGPSSLTLQGRHNFAVIELEIESIDWFQVLHEQPPSQRRAMLRPATGWAAQPLPA